MQPLALQIHLVLLMLAFCYLFCLLEEVITCFYASPYALLYALPYRYRNCTIFIILPLCVLPHILSETSTYLYNFLRVNTRFCLFLRKMDSSILFVKNLTVTRSKRFKKFRNVKLKSLKKFKTSHTFLDRSSHGTLNFKIKT